MFLRTLFEKIIVSFFDYISGNLFHKNGHIFLPPIHYRRLNIATILFFLL